MWTCLVVELPVKKGGCGSSHGTLALRRKKRSKAHENPVAGRATQVVAIRRAVSVVVSLRRAVCVVVAIRRAVSV